MELSVDFLRKLDSLEPELKEILYSLVEELERNREASVSKVEFNELKEIVRALAKAQERTEQRLEELAKAQERTEKILQKLLPEFDDLKKQVGGLSMAVGYGIEDSLFPFIKNFVKNRYGIEATIIDRRYVNYPDGKDDEVNIYVEGVKEGKKQYIIGECKAQPGKKDVDRFSKLTERIGRHLEGHITPLLIGYQVSREVENHIKTKYPAIDYLKTFQVKFEAQEEK